MTLQKLIPVVRESDILPALADTPVGDLLRYHNLGATPRDYTQAELLVIMCMDSRKKLRIPDNFAFVLRSGGANIRRSEFKVSFAVGVGAIGAIAVIGHSDCRMVGLKGRRNDFINGLVENGGWEREEAAAEFDRYVDEFHIDDAVTFARQEAARLRKRYPKTQVTPLFYTVEDNLLHQIVEAT
ncbi:MAG TPA: carbonic anhydrase [Candidatus Krumholzibacteria bacterium]|nr:carbonic anhydrase [Candidatus Krumholzibacteria bacterium]